MDGPGIAAVRAQAYRIPTDRPEADGTFAWDSTTLLLVEVDGGDKTGLGYSYTDAAAVGIVLRTLADAVSGLSALDPQAAWNQMQRVVRNLGRSGIVANAISAVDAALWDLKSKLHALPLCILLGRLRETIPIYGSGGFTTYSNAELRDQLSGWVKRDGCAWSKMKIGSHLFIERQRVEAAKDAIGDATLFVDANGALSVTQALVFAESFANYDVAWFEEPVSSDNRNGLNLLRYRMPAGMDVAASEYLYTINDARSMLESRAVDCLQADVTRVGGVTNFLRIAALCEAHHVDLSGHCAPALHLHVACAAPRLQHLEWFHDHVRIEQMLFDGAPQAEWGEIRPDLSRPGHGLAFKHADAESFLLH